MVATIAKESSNPKKKFQRIECLRGAAALYVMLHHISSNYLQLQKTYIGFPFRFGLEAVILFFVLSGFVITYSVSKNGDLGFGDYFLKRFRRIYPIFLASLLLAALLPVDAGKPGNPETPLWLLANLLMLQDLPSRPGVWVVPFSGNYPLWSLSYECFYYLLFFPVWQFVAQNLQKWLILGLAVTGILMTRLYPNPLFNILSLFPIWWTGVELARSYLKNGSVVAKELAGQAIVLGTCLLLYLGFSLLDRKNGAQLSIILYPLGNLRMYFDVLVFGSIFLVWRLARYKCFDTLFGWFGPIAPISYALYVVHYPIIMGGRLFGDNLFYLDLACRVTLVILLSWVLEKPFQSMINFRKKPPRKTGAPESLCR